MRGRRVTRGAFRRSCRTCGWEGTYATAGLADRAKRTHSCARQLELVARRERGRQRAHAVDRTPKPCLHKQAKHQHGTRATYVLDRCRCLPCTKANTLAEGERNRQKAYGRYDKYVDADPVREHLTALGAYGIGLKRVGRIAGVSNGGLTKIMFGTYASNGTGKSAGRSGPGELLQGPARRVMRVTAEKILAVEATPANLGERQQDHERTPTARLHLRALVALGWSQSELARRIGMNPSNFSRVVRRDDEPMHRGTVDKVEQLYAQLSMRLPPETAWHEKTNATRARRHAAANGWVPPLAIDEEGDDAAVLELHNIYDEAAVVRRLEGDRTAPLHRVDRAEIVRRAHARGLNDAETARLTGIDGRDVLRIRQRLELPPNFEPTRGRGEVAS